MATLDLDKAARCGEPSYVWRAGQERRLRLIVEGFGQGKSGRVLENGCGVGTYVERLLADCAQVFGLEFDPARTRQASQLPALAQAVAVGRSALVNAAGEALPFAEASFSAILSHEVLEHVQDDRAAVAEMLRVLTAGGRMVVFVPNRGYPFETHGIYWRGRYHFGNIPLVNWLPRRLRDRLAPHVRVYSRRDLESLFKGLPVHILRREVLFGAYDNIIARWPIPGRWLRRLLQALEKTPLRGLGLSHFWVIEKTCTPEPGAAQPSRKI